MAVSDYWTPEYTDTDIINADGSAFDPMIDIWSRGSECPPTRTEYDELNPRSAWRTPTLAEVKFGRTHNLFDLDVGWVGLMPCPI